MWVDDTGGFVARLPGGACVGYEVMDPTSKQVGKQKACSQEILGGATLITRWAA